MPLVLAYFRESHYIYMRGSSGLLNWRNLTRFQVFVFFFFFLFLKKGFPLILYNLVNQILIFLCVCVCVFFLRLWRSPQDNAVVLTPAIFYFSKMKVLSHGTLSFPKISILKPILVPLLTTLSPASRISSLPISGYPIPTCVTWLIPLHKSSQITPAYLVFSFTLHIKSISKIMQLLNVFDTHFSTIYRISCLRTMIMSYILQVSKHRIKWAVL